LEPAISIIWPPSNWSKGFLADSGGYGYALALFAAISKPKRTAAAFYLPTGMPKTSSRVVAVTGSMLRTCSRDHDLELAQVGITPGRRAENAP
jgi:hypothetical protein